MSYYPQPGPGSAADPYARPDQPQQPFSANDPYHQPGAPRLEWQQADTHPGSAYPGVVDPYYPGSRAPDEDDDDEPPRRFRRGWLVAIAIGVVVLVLGITVLQNSGSQTDSDKKPEADKASGGLTEQWRSGAPVSMWSATLVQQMLVAIECNQRAGPHANGAECAVRGRNAADGQQRWELAGQPLGVTLVAVGDVVVVSGDGLGGPRENNAGSERAHRRTLLVSAADGRVIKAFDNQIGWMRSQQTIVLRDLPAEGGRQTFTAIDVATGEQRWKFDNARPVDGGINELAAVLPSGAAPTPLFDAEFAAMDGASTTVVRELDTGKDLATVLRTSGDTVGTIAYLDKVLVRVIPGPRVRLEGVSTSNLGNPIWSIELGAAAAVRQCSTMICVSGTQGTASRLVNPETGKVVATNDKGAMYAVRSGEVVVVLRCAAAGSFVNPCPLDTASTEVIAVKNGRQIWRGKSPVFVVASAVRTSKKLLVGTTAPGSNSTEVTAFSGVGRAAEFGSFAGPGLVKAAEVQSEPVIDGYEPNYLPTRLCSMDERRLVCGTRWQLNQVVSWRIVA
ncbi:MAG: hypothetical protein ACRDPW_10010 [Mycobacteriales bacterium]